MECPVSSEYEVCEYKNGYLHFRPQASNNVSSERRENSDRFEVEARRTKPGTLLALVRRLKRHEKEGVPYSVVNKYLRSELGTDDTSPFGKGYIASIITYDPKSDSPLTYAQVYTALDNAPSSFDWVSIWDIVEGLEYD